MAQPVKRGVKRRTTKRKVNETRKRNHPKYGTSKLEDYFATNFLDVLGVKYVRQYEAKEIGRFYDFFIEEARAFIEVDGDYYHSYGLKYEEKNPMQKHNERVDRLKDEWALMQGIPVIRIWEHDIKENPEKVMKMLKERIGEGKERQKKIRDKKKRH